MSQDREPSEDNSSNQASSENDDRACHEAAEDSHSENAISKESFISQEAAALGQKGGCFKSLAQFFCFRANLSDHDEEKRKESCEKLSEDMEDISHAELQQSQDSIGIVIQESPLPLDADSDLLIENKRSSTPTLHNSNESVDVSETESHHSFTRWPMIADIINNEMTLPGVDMMMTSDISCSSQGTSSDSTFKTVSSRSFPTSSRSDGSSLDWITIPSELQLQLESKIQSKVSKVVPVPGVKTVKKTRQKVFILLCLCVCISGILSLASIIMKKSVEEEPQVIISDGISQQFISSLQVERINDISAEWSADMGRLSSPISQQIIKALKPKIQTAIEAEGFSTNSIKITKIGPVEIALYNVLNDTISSLEAEDELSLSSSDAEVKEFAIANMENVIGHRMIIKVEFETSARAYDNALASDIGPNETDKIQSMIGKYLENQGALAKAVSFTISEDFIRQAMTAPSVSTTVFPPNAVIKIGCAKTGKKLGMTRAIISCPARCEKMIPRGVVIGTDWYESSSLICHAAVHSGVLEVGKVGSVEFLTVGDGFMFVGSERNGVTSKSLLRYGEKFIVKKPGPSWTTTPPAIIESAPELPQTVIESPAINQIPLHLRGTYSKGIPVGSGLQLYKKVGGVHYNGKHLNKTDQFRRTEPDDKQAIYRLYKCGHSSVKPVSTARIVGGSQAVAHSWPWIVSINYVETKTNERTGKIDFKYNQWLCGGTIVEAEWILSAAHCFAKGSELKQTTDYKILVGRHDQYGLKNIPGDIYTIRRIIYHPLYEDASNKYDVALLQTHRSIRFRREVSLVCLPNPDVVPKTNKVCVVAGWGYTSNSENTQRNILKQAVQKIEDPNKCQLVYKKLFYDPNISLCSRRSKTARPDSQCRGDSGGPLMCYENTRWVLYGVANWGPRNCDVKGESGYALVPTMMQWLCCYMTNSIGPCGYTRCNRHLL